MWPNKMAITSPALLLLIAVAFADHGYVSQKCTALTSCSDCMASTNNGLTDTSKCIPIVATSPSDEDSDITFLEASSTITCASWDSVQKNSYNIDVQCNNAAISADEQAQIADLRYNVKWAFYAYDAKEGDTLLQSMKIIGSIKFDTRVVMGYDAARQFIVISFRGSSNLMNWISDANYPKSDYVKEGCSSCSVHTGFLNSYSSLVTEVQQYLPVLFSTYSGARVVVTGHSLGAAQAVLGAIDVKLWGYTPYLYTYGCPRVGESNFANYFNSIVTATNLRAVYLDDPVPNLAPQVMNYVHGATEIHFYSCSTYLADPAFADDGQMMNIFKAADHSLYPCIAQGQASPLELFFGNHNIKALVI